MRMALGFRNSVLPPSSPKWQGPLHVSACICMVPVICSMEPMRNMTCTVYHVNSLLSWNLDFGDSGIEVPMWYIHM